MATWSDEEIQVVKDFLATNPTGDEIYAAAASVGLSPTETAQVLALATGSDYAAMQQTVDNYLAETGKQLTSVYKEPEAAPTTATKTTAASTPSRDEIVSSLASSILAQGTTSHWTGEGWGSAEANAKAMAELMADTGITDLKQFGVRENIIPEHWEGGSSEGYLVPERVVKEYYNKETGQALPKSWGKNGIRQDADQTGTSWGGTGEGKGNTAYRVEFDAAGNPYFYTTGHSSSDLSGGLGTVLSAIGSFMFPAAAPYISAGLKYAETGSFSDAVKAGVFAYGGSQLAQGLSGPATAGVSNITDAGFLAADAAQLAAQGISEAQIATTLSQYSSTAAANLAASMAVNGVPIDFATKQLEQLSTNTGLLTQNTSAAELSSADAIQLRNQVGNNAAAIEQNLIASGVDPLVAADLANQVILNPNMTVDELTAYTDKAFGNNIYDVDVAKTYPTSTLPGAGGLLSDVKVVDDVTKVDNKTVDSITDVIKNNPSILELLGGIGGLLGTDALTQAPRTQYDPIPAYVPQSSMPENNDAYYQQMQQYYNAYMPNAPRDITSPLQSWYAAANTPGGYQAPAVQPKVRRSSRPRVQQPPAAESPVEPPQEFMDWTPEQLAGAKEYFSANPSADAIYERAQQLNLSANQLADAYNKAMGADPSLTLKNINQYLSSSGKTLTGGYRPS